MKKWLVLLISVMMLSVLIAPVFAEGRGGGKHYGDNHRRYNNHHHDSRRPRWNFDIRIDLGNPGYYAPYVAPCYDKVYGEWRVDYYGNRYWQPYPYPRWIEIPCY